MFNFCDAFRNGGQVRRYALLQPLDLGLNLVLKIDDKLLLLNQIGLQILQTIVYNVLYLQLDKLLKRIHNTQRKIHLQLEQFLLVVPVRAQVLVAALDSFAMVIIVI